MAFSVASQSIDDGRSFGEGGHTIASETSGSSNRVMVEQLFAENDRDPICLLPNHPEASSFDISKEQYCTTNIYSIDMRNSAFSKSAEARLSSFVSLIDTDGNHHIELCCDPGISGDKKAKSFFRFEFEDEIRKVHVLPLPIHTCLKRQERRASYSATQALGVLLLVVSKRAGMSLHSLVLTRKSARDPFHIAEFAKVSRGTVEGTDSSIAQMATCFQSAHRGVATGEDGKDPILYVALSSCPPSARSCRIDVLACPMVCHKCPLYRYKTIGPTRALKRSLVFTGVGNACGIAVSIQDQSSGLRCTVAALFEDELKEISLPSLDNWSKQALRPEDIVSISTSGADTRCVIFTPLEASNPTETTGRKYAILRCSAQSLDSDCIQQCGTPLVSPVKFESSPGIEATSGRDAPPPGWTINETRNAILRARRDVMANVKETLQNTSLNHPSPSRPFDEESLKTPVRQSTRSSCDPSILDETFDVTISSPDLALLNMSGSRMGRDPSDCVLSPLTGLNFVDQNVTPAEKSREKEAPVQTPHGRDGLVHLMIVTLNENIQSESSDAASTQLIPLPFEFTKIEAICLKYSELELVLAAKSENLDIIRVFRIALTDGHLNDSSAPAHNHRLIGLFPVPEPQTGRRVRALSIETQHDGHINLWAISTSRARPECTREDVANLVEHFVDCKRIEESEEGQSLQPGCDTVVAEKLDAILKSLHLFEARVEERLSSMERKMTDNSNRLSSIEDALTTRVEI